MHMGHRGWVDNSGDSSTVVLRARAYTNRDRIIRPVPIFRTVRSTIIPWFSFFRPD